MSFSCWAINDICERAMEGCLCMVKVLDVRTGLPHQNPTTSRKSSDFDAVALGRGRPPAGQWRYLRNFVAYKAE